MNNSMRLVIGAVTLLLLGCILGTALGGTTVYFVLGRNSASGSSPISNTLATTPNIVGIWRSGSNQLEFFKDGTYSMNGDSWQYLFLDDGRIRMTNRFGAVYTNKYTLSGDTLIFNDGEPGMITYTRVK